MSETLLKIPLARGGFFYLDENIRYYCQGNGWVAGNPVVFVFGNNIKNKTDFTHFKPAEQQIIIQPD
ncbi:hypothetical protein DQ231_18555 [Bacillus spizizenii]|nr:hypothetical protein DQ231_18555 [Bacillus spizizenii]